MTVRTSMRGPLAIVLIVSGSARAGLVSADFSGGVFNPTVGLTKFGIDSGGPPNNQVGGTVVFDDNPALVPTSGYYNLVLSTIPHSDFHLRLGSRPLTFDLAGLEPGGLAAVQFLNGVFNGFVYQGDFSDSGVAYRVSVSSGTWEIDRISDGAFQASGYINIGQNGLSNITPVIIPPTPEPSSLALGLLGALGSLAYAWHRRRVGEARNASGEPDDRRSPLLAGSTT